jgi:endonuclease YncB( thermonuclease family)
MIAAVVMLMLLQFSGLAAGLAEASVKRTPETVETTVLYVIDGDTVKVELDGQSVSVRLYGIDCPEKKQPYGLEAASFLRVTTLNKKVSVRVTSIDLYGRLIGELILDDKNINLMLLEKGLAWWYMDYAPNNKVYMDAEYKAKDAELNIWSDKAAKAPWLYRKEKKVESTGTQVLVK